MSIYAELKGTWRRFLDLTGLSFAEFDQYLSAFEAAYIKVYPSGRPSAHPACDLVPESLAGIEDRLLLIWLSDRRYAPVAELAAQFGLDQPQVDSWIWHLRPVLQLASATLSEPRLSSDGARFLQCLNALEVEYLVVGGHAVAFHGYRRPILDLDVFVATHPANAHKLVRVLQALGHGVPPQAVEFFQMLERVIRIGQAPFTVERFATGDRIIQLGMPPTRYEILTSISAVTFAECYPERAAGIIDGVPVPVIGLAQLRRNKQASASIRPKDADDLAHLC